MHVKIQKHQQIQVNALTHVLTQFSEKVDFEPNIMVKYATKTVIYKFHQMFGTKSGVLNLLLERCQSWKFFVG